VEEAEEEVSRANAKSRKFQREVDDLTEANEQLTRDMAAIRNRTRSNRPGNESQAGRPSRFGGRASAASSGWERTGSNENVLDMTDGSTGSKEGSLPDEGAHYGTNGDATMDHKSEEIAH